MADLTAFVLAGGKSSRMGQDKAFLKLGDKTLLERACTLAASMARDVRIVGDPAKFSSYRPVVEDIYPNRGPLGGIHAALTHTISELNLVIAIDTPFVEVGFLEFLLSEASISGAMVTVPRTGGRLHSLCAIYRLTFATVAEDALIRGQNKVDTLFAGVPTRVIEEKEIVLRGSCPEMFHNLNTPKDWEDGLTRYRGVRTDVQATLENGSTR